VRAAIGAAPSIEQLVDTLFGRLWVSDLTAMDKAFDILLQEAVRMESTRASVKGAYDVLLAEIGAALARSRPDLSAAERRDIAYAITCLAEHNVVMQQLGFPVARSASARAAARALAGIA
jgi:hypothetical protein